MMRKRFAICVNNKGNPVSLDARKIYQILPDKGAAEMGMVRVIDESGEDYLYPADWFVPIRLPEPAKTYFYQSGSY